MRGVTRAVVCLLSVAVLSSALSAAPPEVKDYTAKAGQPVTVVVKATGDIGYKATFAESEAYFEELRERPGERRFTFQSVTPGAYKIVFWTKGETDGSVSTITVGGAPPVPPAPVDPLLAALQAAYTAEPASATKDADRLALAAVMRALSTAVKDPAVKNGDDHFTLLHNSTEARIDGRLKVKLRPAIGAELNKILPSGPGKGGQALSDQNRADAAALYLRVADLLEKGVK